QHRRLARSTRPPGSLRRALIMGTERPRKVAFKTLGCKLNQAETESLATGFRQLGWNVTAFGENPEASPPDAVVINSCTVTDTADRKSRSVWNRAARNVQRDAGHNAGQNAPEKPASLVVLTGCYVDAHRDTLEADGRTYLVGNAGKSHIPQLVDAHFHGEILPGFYEPQRDPFGFPLSEQIFRTRAMVKVQDGCDNYCSFCIIPFVRGRGISRPLSDILQAVENAAESGYREIVLTGINMSRWQQQEGTEPPARFADLVKAVLDVPGNFRIRLGSVEPERISSPLVDLMTHPKMTPHMHLCLQSGSDRILRKMKRRYTAGEFESMARALRSKIPYFNITTDVITGFPGETGEDFQDTLNVCRKVGFGHIHTFPYSRRQGTRADSMDDQIPADVRKERSRIVRELSEELKYSYRQSLVGSVQDVLVEKVEKAEPAENLLPSESGG
ncbi:MAG: tRNA (N(6)-L-threonylcarbamoyladenosine(37)-C(2))-methylthiotransferase MtaB, partial [Spirochaetales bacterium]